MSSERDPQTIERLASAFEQVQTFGGGETAIGVATVIAGATEPIWNAAVFWLIHGEMPTEPTIHGYSPKSLTDKERLVPSAALTALMALQQDPSAALITLKHLNGQTPAACKRDGEGEDEQHLR